MQHATDGVGQWTTRFRFRIDKPFAIDADRVPFSIGGKQGTLIARDGGSLREANWLILRFDGIESEAEANKFASQLAEAIVTTAAKRQFGVDLGKNKPTLQFSDEYIDELKKKTGRTLVNDVHGFMVFQKTGKEEFRAMSATGVVYQNLDAFITAVTAEFEEPAKNSDKLHSATELTALAMMSQDPLAQGTLCMSAIELLALQPWNERQGLLISKLRKEAASSEDLPSEEAEEVSHAMKNVFKSIRQGLKRLVLEELDLGSEVWKALDDLYSLRSAIFHGTSKFDRQANIDFGSRAADLCSRIIAVAIHKHSGHG
ncbi:hypothetical protein [Rhizobium sp. BK068]|uniref:hypothetical protein n=1 Tax=Rhizobium sp. BK068 TaxID=2512130 RepID=UPI00104DD34C|nr:hypothetical protein [Rhizobium sp. BK068]TCM62362.1 hypothetical protein EV291_1537 [Rhizobium sp. BK068]